MKREQLLEAVRGGESISAAARRLGIPRQTVYGWRERDSAFAQTLSDALACQRRAKLRAVSPIGDAPLPDRETLLHRLDAQSRNGSTRATEILLRHADGFVQTAEDRAHLDRMLSLVRQ